MRTVLIFILLNIFRSFGQDTIKRGDYLEIRKDNQIIQKEFTGKNYIKVVYEYKSNILICRRWYNKYGKLIGVSLDN